MTRLFEDIAKRTLEESAAHLAIIYNQVTGVGATVVHAWGHTTDDESRLQQAFKASEMLQEADPVHFIEDVQHDPYIDAVFAREENVQSAALFRLEMKDQFIVVAFGFPTPREFGRCGQSSRSRTSFPRLVTWRQPSGNKLSSGLTSNRPSENTVISMSAQTYPGSDGNRAGFPLMTAGWAVPAAGPGALAPLGTPGNGSQLLAPCPNSISAPVGQQVA